MTTAAWPTSIQLSGRWCQRIRCVERECTEPPGWRQLPRLESEGYSGISRQTADLHSHLSVCCASKQYLPLSRPCVQYLMPVVAAFNQSILLRLQAPLTGRTYSPRMHLGPARTAAAPVTNIRPITCASFDHLRAGAVGQPPDTAPCDRFNLRAGAPGRQVARRGMARGHIPMPTSALPSPSQPILVRASDIDSKEDAGGPAAAA